MQGSDQNFVLNTQTLVAVGGMIGVLSGAVATLFKVLMSTKDDQVKDLKEQVTAVTDDRNYWREQAQIIAKPAERAMEIADDAVRRARAPRAPR